MSQFHVKRAFEVAEQDAFALAGEIIEGEIRPGMFIDFVRGVSCLRGPIHSVESVRCDGGEEVCLMFKCKDESERSLWGLLNIQGEMIRVFEMRQISGID
jgi:hypothetical protein